MRAFIKIHNNIINVENISKVEFISDDIYLGAFPKSEDGDILVDYIPFVFAKAELFSGEKIELQLDLYQPEEGETEECWCKRNRMYINASWSKLKESLGGIEKITDFEYGDF